MTRDASESNFSLFRSGVIGIAGPLAGQHHRFVAPTAASELSLVELPARRDLDYPLSMR